MLTQIKILLLFAGCFLLFSQRQATRCMYIFADKADNINAIQQVNILKSDPAGINSRFITYKVIPWSAANVQSYRKWGVPNSPFTVILIGRDNGEKLRSHNVVTLSKLYNLIDSMPIRKIQIQYKH